MGTQQKIWTAWTAVGLLTLSACAGDEQNDAAPEERSASERGYTFGVNEVETTEDGNPVYRFAFETEGGEEMDGVQVTHALPEGFEPQSAEPEGEEGEGSLTQSWTMDISDEDPVQVEREAVLVSLEAAVQDTDSDEPVGTDQGESHESFESTFCLYKEAGGEEIYCLTSQTSVGED